MLTEIHTQKYIQAHTSFLKSRWSGDNLRLTLKFVIKLKALLALSKAFPSVVESGILPGNLKSSTKVTGILLVLSNYRYSVTAALRKTATNRATAVWFTTVAATASHWIAVRVIGPMLQNDLSIFLIIGVAWCHYFERSTAGHCCNRSR